jgi:hypothetical protein
MEVRRLKHHRIGGGVDEAEWTVGDDFFGGGSGKRGVRDASSNKKG